MQHQYQFVRLNAKIAKRIDSLPQSTCFHTEAWLRYVHRCGYRSMIAEIKRENNVVGYFVGTEIGYGLKMICAPLDSLGYTQGVVTEKSISYRERVEIYRQLSQWLFETHQAVYLSVDDWQLREDRREWTDQFKWRYPALDEAGLKYTVRPTLYLQMDKSIDDLWAGLHYKSAKYSINKARKLGLHTKVINCSEDIADFVRVHYDHICDVCNRHNAGKPKLGQSYGRLLKACEELFPDNVLMLQVLGNDENGVEQVMSSAAFFIGKEQTIYNTGGSYQCYQKYCPNELMVWEAIRILREKGVRALNFGGMDNYKLKFGTQYAYVPRLIFSKYAFIDKIRNYAKHIYHKLVR